jgi:hypothetical protein
VFKDDELTAVAALSAEKRLPILRSFPTAINDRFTVVTRPGRLTLQTAEVLAAVMDASPDVPLFIERLDPAVVAAVRGLRPGCKALVLDWITSPAIPLPHDWETYLAQLSHDARAGVLRSMRKAEELDLVPEIIEDPPAVALAVRASLELRRRVWAADGRHEHLSPLLASPRWDEFLVDASGQAAVGGAAFVVNTRHKGGDVVASTLCFRHGAQVLGYHRAAERTRANLGRILDLMLIRTCIEARVQVLDYGRGGEEYKYRLGALDQPLCDVVLSYVHPRALAAIAFQLGAHARPRLRYLGQTLPSPLGRRVPPMTPARHVPQHFWTKRGCEPAEP